MIDYDFEPERALVQLWVTKAKEPRLFKWSQGAKNKSATMRLALNDHLFGMRAQLDRIEKMLIELVGERGGE